MFAPKGWNVLADFVWVIQYVMVSFAIPKQIWITVVHVTIAARMGKFATLANVSSEQATLIAITTSYRWARPIDAATAQIAVPMV